MQQKSLQINVLLVFIASIIIIDHEHKTYYTTAFFCKAIVIVKQANRLFKTKIIVYTMQIIHSFGSFLTSARNSNETKFYRQSLRSPFRFR
jgi:hypothetical protein